jgi:hypothetical protein
MNIRAALIPPVKTDGVLLKTVSVATAKLQSLMLKATRSDFPCCRSLSWTLPLAYCVLTESTIDSV